MVAVEKACEAMKAAGAKRATGWWCIPLSMMEPAREELEAALRLRLSLL
jgi:hypothetical protein